jgi:DNA-binding transcriptional LysR family regulator
LNLRALRVLRAVAASGSQAAASRTLNVAPSAISRTIVELEAELGFALFRRDKGRLIPTQPGRAFALEVERVFREVDMLADTARVLRAAGGERLRVMVPPSLLHYFLPETLRRFAASHPHTRLEIDYGPAASGMAALAQGRADIAVLSLPIDAAGLEMVPLIDVETVCLVPVGHVLAAKAAISPADLDRQKVVLIDRRFALREKLDDLFRRAGAVPDIRVETSSGAAAAGCAQVGIGIAVVSRLIAGQADGDPRLVVRPFRPTVWQKFAAAIGPGVADSSVRGPAVEGFVKALKATAAEYRRKAALRR